MVGQAETSVFTKIGKKPGFLAILAVFETCELSLQVSKRLPQASIRFPQAGGRLPQVSELRLQACPPRPQVSSLRPQAGLSRSPASPLRPPVD